MWIGDKKNIVQQKTTKLQTVETSFSYGRRYFKLCFKIQSHFLQIGRFQLIFFFFFFISELKCIMNFHKSPYIMTYQNRQSNWNECWVHGWKFSVFWLISVFLAKVQTILEIRVNLMIIFFRVEVCIFDKEIKNFERILICVNSIKFSIFVKKKPTLV